MRASELRQHLEQHHAESYGWALSCCGQNAAEAEDVLQTVYLKVLEGKARYQGKSAFRTWLFAVIRKTAVDAYRKKKRHHLRLVPFEEEPLLARDEDAYHERAHHVPLRSLLLALPVRQREVLHLVFYQDLTIAEAALVMGITVGSARTHYERGKKRLRQWMEALMIAQAG